MPAKVDDRVDEKSAEKCQEDIDLESAMEEEEEPFSNQPQAQVEENITTQKVDKEESKAKRVEKRYFSAFRLIIGCLIFLGVIYFFDSIFSIKYDKVSSTTEGIIEIVKTLLFTLSGYLFARKENNDT